MSVSVAPLFLLINSLLEKQLQVCYLSSETVEVKGVMNSPIKHKQSFSECRSYTNENYMHFNSLRKKCLRISVIDLSTGFYKQEIFDEFILQE